eukprot:6606883-Lingulodinium_polyedra.AAC.1
MGVELGVYRKRGDLPIFREPGAEALAPGPGGDEHAPAKAEAAATAVGASSSSSAAAPAVAPAQQRGPVVKDDDE